MKHLNKKYWGFGDALLLRFDKVMVSFCPSMCPFREGLHMFSASVAKQYYSSNN